MAVRLNITIDEDVHERLIGRLTAEELSRVDEALDITFALPS